MIFFNFNLTFTYLDNATWVNITILHSFSLNGFQKTKNTFITKLIIFKFTKYAKVMFSLSEIYFRLSISLIKQYSIKSSTHYLNLTSFFDISEKLIPYLITGFPRGLFFIFSFQFKIYIVYKLWWIKILSRIIKGRGWGVLCAGSFTIYANAHCL